MGRGGGGEEQCKRGIVVVPTILCGRDLEIYPTLGIHLQSQFEAQVQI